MEVAVGGFQPFEDPTFDVGGAVVPLRMCPHVHAVLSSSYMNGTQEVDTGASCSVCGDAQENWMCLSCGEVLCGRYRNGHGVKHFESLEHPMALSFSDLSVWCHSCESYVHHAGFENVKVAAHTSKFGQPPPDTGTPVGTSRGGGVSSGCASLDEWEGVSGALPATAPHEGVQDRPYSTHQPKGQKRGPPSPARSSPFAGMARSSTGTPPTPSFALVDNSVDGSDYFVELSEWGSLFYPDGRRSASVGVAYDPLMGRHRDRSSHPECPARITQTYDHFVNCGFLGEKGRCIHIECPRARPDHLSLVHSERHQTEMHMTAGKSQVELDEFLMDRGFNSVYLHPDTNDCALLATGGVVECVRRVCLSGRSTLPLHPEALQSAVAVVRPPGHHAEANCCMGFCVYNSVAVAAAAAIDEGWAQKVLIVDWDVHHGNGTQHAFYDRDDVLVISLHRYDGGAFYPCKEDANYTYTGDGAGAFHNINISWNPNLFDSQRSRMGDADYLTAFHKVVMPIAQQFAPDLVLVSSGFDAAVTDPLGGYLVTPWCYGQMTRMLMSVADGRVVVALEGGYSLPIIALCMEEVLRALLGDRPGRRIAWQQYYRLLPNRSSAAAQIIKDAPEVSPHFPSASAIALLDTLQQRLAPYWSNLGCVYGATENIQDPGSAAAVLESSLSSEEDDASSGDAD